MRRCECVTAGSRVKFETTNHIFLEYFDKSRAHNSKTAHSKTGFH